MQSATVLDQIVDDPRCSTSADNEFDIVPPWCPWIPEMLKATDEVRAWCIHPGHFINENNFLPLGQWFKITLQCQECVKPCFYMWQRLVRTMFPDTLHEINQLYFLCYLIHTSNIESIVIAYNLLDKTRFSHTSAPIHSDEFRLIWTNVILQLFLFFFSSDK